MNFDAFKDSAHISIQTLAVVFLGWLSTEMNQLNIQLKELNNQMVEIVVITRQHDKDITSLKSFADQLNGSFVSRQDFETGKKDAEASRNRIWDAINKVVNGARRGN